MLLLQITNKLIIKNQICKSQGLILTDINYIDINNKLKY